MSPTAGRDYPRSYAQLRGWFEEDGKCLDYLDWLRWPDQSRRPGGAQARSKQWVGWLQRVVPVAMSVSRQGAAGYRAGCDDGQSTTDMLHQRRRSRGSVVVDKRDSFAEYAGIPGHRQILSQCQNRPEDDVAVSVPLAAPELPRVELEGLGDAHGDVVF